MFDEICSIYASATDNKGRFVDMETGECITEMSIREFCLTDRWKPYVQELRDLIAKHGGKAKKMPEYIETKKMLPGATPSGRFGLWEDDCTTKDGRVYRDVVSRRESHLLEHTGWLVIDIDLGDNASLSNFNNIRVILEDRPEVALLMRSCSGTGFFGLVRLAYPQYHKQQFKALMREYAALGITLDKQCSNIGRVRFASWDDPEHIYINERATVYMGVAMEDMVLAPQAAVVSHTAKPYGTVAGTVAGAEAGQNGGSRPERWWEDTAYILRMTELLISALVSGRHSITHSYEDWVKAGWSLKHHPQGEKLFHQISSIDTNYKPGETAQKWNQLGTNKVVTHEYLFSQCRKALTEDEYRRISIEAWNSR